MGKHFLHKYRSVPIFSANITNLTHTPNFHLKLTRVIPTFNMRVSGLLAVALAAIPGVLGKSVIVYFDDNNTPDSIVDQAKKDIVSAGGKITHVYSIIKGFAADAQRKRCNLCRPGATSTRCVLKQTRRFLSTAKLH